LACLKELSSTAIDGFFQGRYTWFYYHNLHKDYDALFIQTLRNAAWLRNAGNEWKHPFEISPQQLHEDYEVESREAKVLIEKLQFKPDIEHQYVQQLSEEHRRIHSLVRELQSKGVDSSSITDALNKLLGIPAKLVEPVIWEPDITPAEVPINIEERQIEAELDIPPQHPELVTNKPPKPPGPIPPPPPIAEPREEAGINAKKIGRWGETYVFESLKDEYSTHGTIVLTDWGFSTTDSECQSIEVLWLNILSDQGKGCDLIVRMNNKEAKYIEVKTKTSEDPEFITITGTQWELARVGEAYWIYLVSNAGHLNSKITPIQNPRRLWQEGKLTANPVTIKL
jgi:hypothetical protein